MTFTVCISLLMFGQTASAPSIPWRDTPDAALAEAKRTGKFAAIYFYADWCQFSKHHDTEVLTDPKVITLFERFVPSKVDSETQRPIMRRFRAAGHPTVLILDGDGKRVYEVSGSPTPAEYVVKLQVCIDTVYEKPGWERRAAENASDGEALVRLAWLAIRCEEFDRAESLMDRAAEKNTGSATELLSRAFLALGNHTTENRDYDAAMTWYQKALAAARGAEEEAEARLAIAAVHFRRQQNDEMQIELDKVIALPGVPPAATQRADDLMKRVEHRDTKRRESEARKAKKQAAEIVGPPASAPSTQP